MMNIPLLDLQAQYQGLKHELNAAVAEVMESQRFILGPKVQECEKAIAEYSGCSFGVGVSSGSDALLICLMAEGIGPGDEVITTPFTFFATVGSIARVGAKAVFVDIDPVTYNIDATQVEAKVTGRTRAIIPVHLYGQMCDMDAILEVARKHNLTVIEDAAQAIGAEHGGRRAGSQSDYGCFSFFPSKNLGAAGDGGIVVTNDADRAEKLRHLRSHGSNPKYYHKMIGGNFRLDAMQAAIVLVKLKYLDDWTNARRDNAERYRVLFSATGLNVYDSAGTSLNSGQESESATEAPWIILPRVMTDRHIFNQYVIRTGERDRFREELRSKGVSTEIYYPVPMHLQDCFSYLEYSKGDFPESEQAARDTLALPVYPELTDQQAEYVVATAHQCLLDEFSASKTG